MQKIKYLIMDVDGTLTDGKIYIGADGEVMKAFSVKDGVGINYYLRKAEIMPIIITARESTIVERRCKEIGINRIYQGYQNKEAALQEAVKEEEICSCAYIGDDLPDFVCMEKIKKAGGVLGCPADAVEEIREICDFISGKNGGEGAVRDFIEWLIK